MYYLQLFRFHIFNQSFNSTKYRPFYLYCSNRVSTDADQITEIENKCRFLFCYQPGASTSKQIRKKYSPSYISRANPPDFLTKYSSFVLSHFTYGCSPLVKTFRVKTEIANVCTVLSRKINAFPVLPGKLLQLPSHQYSDSINLLNTFKGLEEHPSIKSIIFLEVFLCSIMQLLPAKSIQPCLYRTFRCI